MAIIGMPIFRKILALKMEILNFTEFSLKMD